MTENVPEACQRSFNYQRDAFALKQRPVRLTDSRFVLDFVTFNVISAARLVVP